jgi:very-short-patch-repair endonuclease
LTRLSARFGVTNDQKRATRPIGPYVLDFYCAKARLAVEIDGMSHDTADRPERDA